MKIEISPVLAAIAAGVLAFITAVITAWLTRRREDWAADRQARKEKATATRSLFEDAVAVLNAHISNVGMGDSAHGERIYAIQARMALLHRADIRTLFDETAALIDRWAANEREASPKKMGGYVVYTASITTQKYRDEADRLRPLLWGSFDRLKSEMATELEILENGPSKLRAFRARRVKR